MTRVMLRKDPAEHRPMTEPWMQSNLSLLPFLHAAGKGSGLASMWSKAPPKKAAADKAEKKRPAASASRLGAVDAGAALDMAQQVMGSPHFMLLVWWD